MRWRLSCSHCRRHPPRWHWQLQLQPLLSSSSSLVLVTAAAVVVVIILLVGAGDCSYSRCCHRPPRWCWQLQLQLLSSSSSSLVLPLSSVVTVLLVGVGDCSCSRCRQWSPSSSLALATAAAAVVTRHCRPLHWELLSLARYPFVSRNESGGEWQVNGRVVSEWERVVKGC